MRLFVPILAIGILACAKASDISPTVEGLASRLQEGDIVFVESQSRQAQAIRAATKSPWSHVGVVMMHEGRTQVIEAGARGVAVTSLASFVSAGKDRRISVHRLDTGLDPRGRDALRASLKKHLSKPYDLHFLWDDQRLYCSELVWKAYRDALQIELGTPQTFSDLDLSSDAVNQLIESRYKMTTREFMRSDLRSHKILSPAALMSSSRLESVYEGVVR